MTPWHDAPVAHLSRIRKVVGSTAFVFGSTLALLHCAGGKVGPNGTPHVASSSSSSSSKTASMSDAGAAAPATTPTVSAHLNRSMPSFPNAFAPDGLTVGRIVDTQCETWDVLSGRYRGTFDRATCTAWQEEGARLHDVKVVEVCKAKASPCKGAKAIAPSPKKDEVAIHYGGGSENPITVVDAASGAKKRQVVFPGLAKGLPCERMQLAWNEENLVALCEQGSGGHGSVSRFPQGIAPKEEIVDNLNDATHAVLDPFGHVVLIREIFFGGGGSQTSQRVIGMTRALDRNGLSVGPPEGAVPDPNEREIPFVLPKSRASFSNDGRVLGLPSGVA